MVLHTMKDRAMALFKVFACLMIIFYLCSCSKVDDPAVLPLPAVPERSDDTTFSENADPKCFLLDKESIDLGNVLAGKSSDCTFSVQNIGKQPLLLTQKSKTCDCLLLEAPGAIAPGAMADILLSMDVPVPGRRMAAVSFTTNDPMRPSLDLTLSCHGTREVYTDPPQLILDGKAEENGTPLKLATYPHLPPFRVLGVRDSSSLLTVAEPASFPTEPSHEHVIKLQALADVWKRQKIALIIETDNPVAPIIECPVTIGIPCSYEVIPQDIRFGVTEPGKTYHVDLTIRGRAGLGFSLERIEGSNLVVSSQTDLSNREGVFHNTSNLSLELIAPQTDGIWTSTVSILLESEEHIKTTLHIFCHGLNLLERQSS